MSELDGIFYKTTQLSGQNYHAPARVNYADALASGQILRHPTSTRIDIDDHASFLSLAITPGDSAGNHRLPFRLFRVQAVGEVKRMNEAAQHWGYPPTWFAALAVRVLEELPAHVALGDNGPAVVAFFGEVSRASDDQLRALGVDYLARGAKRLQGAGEANSSGQIIAAATASAFMLRLVGSRLLLAREPLEMALAASEAAGDAAAAVALASYLPPTAAALTSVLC